MFGFSYCICVKVTIKSNVQWYNFPHGCRCNSVCVCSDCREILLPLMTDQLKFHLEQHEELEACCQLLSNILEVLYRSDVVRTHTHLIVFSSLMCSMLSYLYAHVYTSAWTENTPTHLNLSTWSHTDAAFLLHSAVVSLRLITQNLVVHTRNRWLFYGLFIP